MDLVLGLAGSSPGPPFGKPDVESSTFLFIAIIFKLFDVEIINTLSNCHVISYICFLSFPRNVGYVLALVIIIAVAIVRQQATFTIVIDLSFILQR